MKTVSIREAKNRLTELAREVEAGERITVTRNGKPVMELVQLDRKGGINWEAGEAYLKSRGLDRAMFWIAPDFDDPLPEDFLITPMPDPPPRKIR
jgi:prevent-host-death family protein